MNKNYAVAADEKINWLKSMPFIILHLSPFALFFVDVTWRDVLLCVAAYYIRMFFITAGYHRYFSHRSYKMGRVAQFFMALGGTLALQKGPLWWASHHRLHHKYSDTDLDVHSPKKGFFWSHVGWILCSKYEEARYDKIGDFAKYPELRLLDRFYVVPPVIAGALVWYAWGPGALVVGGLISTLFVYHGTFVINSLAHVFGTRRFATTDTSRNSLILALLTCGEGWHNNHHHFQSSARQGFRWWEVDFSFYVLKLLSWVRIVKDLKSPSKKALSRGLIAHGYFDSGMFNAYFEKAARSINGVKNEAITMYEKKQEMLEKIMEESKTTADELANLSMDQKVNNFSPSR